MGNPVALLVVVSPRVKFHSVECDGRHSLWRCSAAWTAGAQSVSTALFLFHVVLCRKHRLFVRQTHKPELM